MADTTPAAERLRWDEDSLLEASAEEILAELDRLTTALERIVAWDESELRNPEYLTNNIIPAARAALRRES